VSRFAIARADGRSNADVLVAFVEAATPGETYPYNAIGAALAVGTERAWDTRAVQSAVRTATPRVLRETRRVLHPVATVGYRVSQGGDHSRLALARERRGNTQIRAALDVLRNVQWDEMTSSQRALHEAQMTVTSAVVGAVELLHRRQKKQGAAIEALLKRVETLETQPTKDDETDD